MSSGRRRQHLAITGRWRPLLWLFPLGIAGNLLYALLAIEPAALRASLRLDWRWLFLAAGLTMLPVLLNSVRVWRWSRLLAPGFRWRAALRVVLLAEVGAAVTPTAIGGAPLKVGALARSGLGPAGGMTVATLGGCEDAVFILLAIPLGAIATGLLPRFFHDLQRVVAGVAPDLGTVLLGLAAVLAVLAVVSLFKQRGAGLLGARLRDRLQRGFGELAAHARLVRRRGGRTFAGNVLLAGLQWSARLSIVTALAAGLGAPLEPVRAAVLQWLCFTCMTLMPIPGAAGGAEASFMLVFGRELPEPLLPLVVATWRLLTFYMLNIACLLVLIAGRRRIEAIEPSAASRSFECAHTGRPSVFCARSILDHPG